MTLPACRVPVVALSSKGAWWIEYRSAGMDVPNYHIQKALYHPGGSLAATEEGDTAR